MKGAIRIALLALAVWPGVTLAQVVVRVAPPVAVVEHPGPAPGPTYVWVGGYHRWDGHRYVWVPGHYVVPPRAGGVWVPAHWVARNGGWVFVEGHWRYTAVAPAPVPAPAPAPVIIRVAPPSIVVEHPGPSPGPNYIWVGGYHRWNGSRYIWVPGHYVVPPRRGAVWVSGHWVQRGGGWVYVEGYWR